MTQMSDAEAVEWLRVFVAMFDGEPSDVATADQTAAGVAAMTWPRRLVFLGDQAHHAVAAGVCTTEAAMLSTFVLLCRAAIEDAAPCGRCWGTGMYVPDDECGEGVEMPCDCR